MLQDELRNIVQGEVSSEDKELYAYSQDASIFEVRPSIVVKPKNTEDIKKLIKFVSEKKNSSPELSLTARSGGTDMTGGPLTESIIVDFTAHFNHISEIQGASLHTRTPLVKGWAVVKPGVYYRDFEKETLAKNLLLPSYPASREICTVGGMVANNSGGEKSLAYGKTEKYVEELNIVLSDGNEYIFHALTPEQLEEKKSLQNFEGQIYRQMHELIEKNYDAIKAAKPDVSKNSAGYYLWNVYPPAQAGDKKTFDLTKLFVGSQGTLGLVTKIKFGLIQPKKYSKLLIIFLKDLKPLGELVNAVVKYRPESFESYDDQTLKLAVRFFPSMIRKMKGNAFLLAFKFLPEAWMILTGGLPKLVLLAEFTDDDELEAKKRLKLAKEEVQSRFHVATRTTKNSSESEKYWTIRRESFNLLRKNVGNKHTAPFIDDVIVHVNQLPTFLPRLNELVSQYKGLTYTIAGHAGDANFHVIPLMDFRDPANRAAVSELSEKVYDLVISLHGSITAEHNDGLIRTPYLEKMYGPEIVELFEKTKQIFDPLNIFNPGKKVGGNMQYAISHIKKE